MDWKIIVIIFFNITGFFKKKRRGQQSILTKDKPFQPKNKKNIG